LTEFTRFVPSSFN